MQVQSFLHADTETFSHVLIDTDSQQCAIIDPVLDFDYPSGRTNTHSVQTIIDFITDHQLTLKYIIETHAHADHLSAAPYVKEKLGGQLVIGRHITEVQKVFKHIFHLGDELDTDASQFDILTDEGSTLELGQLVITALHVPGHTPADMAYLVSDKDKEKAQKIIFVGDTLFAPDVGTARCDFPKGNAHCLYQSIQKILSLPDETIIYLCHDYPPSHRDYSPITTVKAQKEHNIHVKEGISEEDFVYMRTQRDKTLSMPRLLLPSVQVNIQAGKLPTPESNGVHYLKIPINQFE